MSMTPEEARDRLRDGAKILPDVMGVPPGVALVHLSDAEAIVRDAMLGLLEVCEYELGLYGDELAGLRQLGQRIHATFPEATGT